MKTCQRSIIGIKSLYNHNGYKESFNFNNWQQWRILYNRYIFDIVLLVIEIIDIIYNENYIDKSLITIVPASAGAILIFSFNSVKKLT